MKCTCTVALHDETVTALLGRRAARRLRRHGEVTLLLVPLQTLRCLRARWHDYAVLRVVLPVVLRGARPFLAASTLASSAAIRSRTRPSGSSVLSTISLPESLRLIRPRSSSVYVS